MRYVDPYNLEGTCVTDLKVFINSSNHIITHTISTFTNGFLMSSMSSASSSVFFSFGPTRSDNYKGRKKTFNTFDIDGARTTPGQSFDSHPSLTQVIYIANLCSLYKMDALISELESSMVRVLFKLATLAN